MGQETGCVHYTRVIHHFGELGFYINTKSQYIVF